MKVNQTNFEKKLYVGLGEITPLCFNPTRKELKKIFGKEDEEKENEEEEEFEYVNDEFELTLKKENGEEEIITTKKLNITVWVRENNLDKIFPINFTLYDVEDISKSGKKKYINQHGKSLYSEELVMFTPGKKKFSLKYRVAKRGEDQFFNFLALWTNINPFDIESTLFPENEKNFWKGDMSELNSLLKDLPDNSVLAQFGVKTKEVYNDEGEATLNEYQSIFTKNFCHVRFQKFYNKFLLDGFEKLKKEDGTYNTSIKIGEDSMYGLSSFLNGVYGEYGYKDYTSMDKIRVYSPEENPLNMEENLIEENIDEDDLPF
ncbi:MAG: hypothetical protein KC589_03245 [Nanoarchaeota archaeon]|nr:hypothetical protein [Nanoarchaeota archaeon]